MKTAILLALLLAAGNSFADEAGEAAAADCLTTGAGLATGMAVELNPLGPFVACAAGLAFIEEARKLPEPQRTEELDRIAAVKWGAAANNLAVIANIPGGAAIGLFVGFIVWSQGAEEREFMQQCAIHEQLAGHKMTCHYERSKT